jgi:putative ATP-dependent endonuclease of OLD family
MRIARVVIENFRGIAADELHFNGHTALVGDNNTGKSTVLEAIDLVLALNQAYCAGPRGAMGMSKR